jgi:alpha-glucosidase
VVVARRSGQEWFLGGLTGSGAYDASVSLAFLKKGRWRLRLWRDATDSDVNAEHLEIEERVVTAQDVLKIHCAPAGGFVAWLRRE